MGLNFNRFLASCALTSDEGTGSIEIMSAGKVPRVGKFSRGNGGHRRRNANSDFGVSDPPCF